MKASGLLLTLCKYSNFYDIRNLNLAAGRFLAGSGAGAASLYVPRYLAEIAPVAVRGGIATLNQVHSSAFLKMSKTRL